MPQSNDKILVTGAGDCKIRVHDIALKDTVMVCTCHNARVKRIATAPGVPFLFWSAGEDGLVLQNDMRVPHTCKNSDRKSVLINLINHTGRSAEAKCISINPVRPELVAVGASDAYIRMYDRRMIKLSQVSCIVDGEGRIFRTYKLLLLQKPAHNPPQNYYLDESGSSNAGIDDSDNNIPLGCAQYFIAGYSDKVNAHFSSLD